MTRKTQLVVIAICMLLVPSILSACPVCYGAPNSPMTKSSNNAIMFLLGVVGFVQVGFIALFWSFLAAGQGVAPPAGVVPSDGRRSGALAPRKVASMEKFLAQWMPVDASEHGPYLDRLSANVHWLMLVLFIGWGLYFAYVLWRFNAKRNPKASYHGVQSHFSSYTEAGVAVVEVILLVGFSIPMWYRVDARAAAVVESAGNARCRGAIRLERSVPRPGRRFRKARHQTRHLVQPSRPRSRTIRTRRTTSSRSMTFTSRSTGR